MVTYLIEITNNKAHKLLQDLEDLQIIKVLKKEMHEKQVNKSSTAQFRGALKLSDKQYLDFQKHAKDIRNEY